jgi:hypothetical protein
MVMGLVRIVRRGRQAIHHQRGGCGKAIQRALPIGFGCRNVLPFEPHNIVAVGSSGWQLQVSPPAKCLIEGKHLLKQQRPRPAVQQNVMVGPYQRVSVIRRTQQGQPEQGRAVQIKPLLALRLKQGIQARLLLGGIQPAPVLLLWQNGYFPVHHLHRLFQPLPP